jgi:hypothetical protein
VGPQAASAARVDPRLRAYDERLVVRGKLPRAALAAAGRKPLVAIDRVAQHRRPVVPHRTPDGTPV